MVSEVTGSPPPRPLQRAGANLMDDRIYWQG